MKNLKVYEINSDEYGKEWVAATSENSAIKFCEEQNGVSYDDATVIEITEDKWREEFVSYPDEPQVNGEYFTQSLYEIMNEAEGERPFYIAFDTF